MTDFIETAIYNDTPWNKLHIALTRRINGIFPLQENLEEVFALDRFRADIELAWHDSTRSEIQ